MQFIDLRTDRIYLRVHGLTPGPHAEISGAYAGVEVVDCIRSTEAST